MIKLIKNAWKFRKELSEYDDTDWDSTESLLLRSLQLLKLHPGEPELSRKRIIDILQRRLSGSYETPKFEVEQDPETHVLTLKDITNWAELERIKDRDFDYALEQIKIYHKQWF